MYTHMGQPFVIKFEDASFPDLTTKAIIKDIKEKAYASLLLTTEPKSFDDYMKSWLDFIERPKDTFTIYLNDGSPIECRNIRIKECQMFKVNVTYIDGTQDSILCYSERLANHLLTSMLYNSRTCRGPYQKKQKRLKVSKAELNSYLIQKILVEVV